MLLLTIVGMIVFVFGICWAISTNRKRLGICSSLIGFVFAFWLGHGTGKSFERFRNYGQFVFPFSQYSKHLRGLVEANQVDELTNSVVLFDVRFNARQDPKDLQDVVMEIRGVGKYYKEEIVTPLIP